MTQEHFPEYETAPLNTWWNKIKKTPEKQTAEGNLSTDMTPFLKLAKAQCCNYAESGPHHIKHYCWLEPLQSQKECLLTRGLPCKRFVEAVLPRSPELAEEWKRMLLRQSDPDQDQVQREPRTIFLTCSCGKLFKRKSPRQSRCEECGKKNKARLSRITSQRNREKKVAA